MIELTQIASFYPDYLKPFKKNILREYLQYKILEIIFDSEYREQLSFMGGTALRIIHGNTRFSEDLDFDNRGLSKEDFENLAILIKKKLRLEGYSLEYKVAMRKAFRCYLKIQNLLFDNNISLHEEEKLLVQLDTEPQAFDYVSDKVIMSKFDVFLRINVVPIDILLAQKLACIFTRKRILGRDFYDIVFLLGKTTPNLSYIKQKLSINDGTALKKEVLLKCRNLNFKLLAEDVSPFLFSPSDKKKIIYFEDFIKGINFSK